jgi:dihydroflavonol-4-reductase
MKKLYFVTGGTGFLGAHLLHCLVDRGERVRALRRTDSSMDLVASIQDRIEWVEGDVLDVVALEEAMVAVDYVFHCAAMVSFDPADRKRMAKINVEGTANVVNAALEAQVKKFLFVSSIAALGRQANRPHVNETARWEAGPLNTTYGHTKFLAECEVWRGQEEGLDVVVVNPAIIIGAGRWDQASGRFFRQVHQGMSFYPTGVTGFVDVRDVVTAMLRLMESDISGERFILSGENLSYKSFLSKIATVLSKKAPHRQATPLLTALAWRADWLRSKFTGEKPLLTEETARSSAAKCYYDSGKIVETLEDFVFTPMDVSIRGTARRFLEAVKAGKNHTEPEP